MNRLGVIKWTAMALAAALMSACSSSNVVRVPTQLETLNSTLTIERNWQVQLNAMPNYAGNGLAFAQDQKAVFTADAQGLISAFKKANQSRWTDQVIWQSRFDEKVVSGPTYFDGQLVVGTAKGKVVALSADRGEVLWQTQLSSEVLSRPVFARQKLFTRTVDGHLYALDATNGQVVWVTEHQIPNLSLRGSAPVLYDRGVLYVGWETGKIEAISAESGVSLWESRIAIPSGRTDLERMVDVQAALVLKNDRLIALGYQGKLAALNLENGNLYFAQDVSGYRDFVADDQAIYVVDEDDVLHAFDLSNGTKLWSQVGLKYRNLADLIFYQDKLLAIDGYGYLHWLNKTHGTIVARAKHSNDFGDENIVLDALAQDDTLYLLDNKGGVNSYHVMPSDLVDKYALTDSGVKRGQE